jgi:hypothetical protein
MRNPSDTRPKAGVDIEVHWDANDRIGDKLSKALFPKRLALNKRVSWTHLPTMGHVMYFIRRWTYFGKMIFYPPVVDYDEETGMYSSRAPNTDARNKLIRFLAGEKISPVKMRNWESVKPNRYRMGRFLQILNNADGVVYQLLLAFPECRWNFDLVDAIAHAVIMESIIDESLPLSTPDKRCSTTFWSSLKRLRKAVKFDGHLQEDLGDIESSHSTVNKIYKIFLEQIGLDRSRASVYSITILSQTRGMSTPPQCIVGQSSRKFKKTVTVPCAPLERKHAKLINQAMVDEWTEGFDPKVSDRTASKVKLAVTFAATWEELRKDGGKLEACRKILNEIEFVQRTNLSTGEPEGVIYNPIKHPGMLETAETLGEFMFYWALQETMKDPENALNVEYVVANEPGKARAVTKAVLATTLLLFPWKCITSSGLGTIPSSQAGLEKGNQMWQFFKRMVPANPAAEFMFRTNERPSKKDGVFTETYNTLFGYSADYETATDFADWNVGKVVGHCLSDLCGIPKWYSTLVLEILCGPRKVFLSICDEVDGTALPETIDVFWTQRGIMMGDPGCKVLLHCINICIRRISNDLSKPMENFHRKFKPTKRVV